MSVIIQELEANEPSTAAAAGLVPAGLATAVLPWASSFTSGCALQVPSEDNEPAELNVHAERSALSCDTISAVSAKLYTRTAANFPHGADLVTEEVFATAPRDAISDLSWQAVLPTYVWST